MTQFYLKFTFVFIQFFLLINVFGQVDSLVFQPDSLCGKDAISISTPASTNHSIFQATAWTTGGTPIIARSFIEFEQLNDWFADIPDIDSAFLFLYPRDSDNNSTSWPRDYCNNSYLTRIIEPWEEGNNYLDWNNQPSITNLTDSESRVEIPEDDCACGTGPDCRFYNTAKVDITDIVNYWRANPNENYGLRFNLETEEYYNRKAFVSSDYYDPARHPKLVLYFGEELNIAIEDNCEVIVEEEPCDLNGELSFCMADAGTLNLEQTIFCQEENINVSSLNYLADSCYVQTYVLASNSTDSTIFIITSSNNFDLSTITSGEYVVYALNYQITTIDLDNLNSINQLWDNESELCFDLTSVSISIGIEEEVQLSQNILSVCNISNPIILDDYQISNNGIWTNNAGTIVTEFIPNFTGNYEFTYTAGNGSCSNSDTLSINVSESLEVLLNTNELNSCQGNTIVLDNYQDSNNGIWTSNTGETITEFTSTAPGNYDFTYTAGTATCSDSDVLTITVFSISNVQLTQNNLNICSGSNSIILADYQMSSNGFWTNMAGEFVTEFIPSLAGDYDFAYLASINGCLGSDTLTINVFSSISPPTAQQIQYVFCQGESFVITATGENLNWYSNEDLSDSPTVGPLFIAPTIGTYYVTQTINNCESAPLGILVSLQNLSEEFFTQSEYMLCNSAGTEAGLDLNTLLKPEMLELGEWSGIGVENNQFNNDFLNPGMYSLAYTILETETCPPYSEFIIMTIADTLTFTEEIICNVDNSAFRIRLEIEGGLEPYYVNGAKIQGANYLSDWMPAGSYELEISDELSCKTYTSGQNICEQIAVYPVPSDGLFNIFFNRGFEEIEDIELEIFDSMGQWVGKVAYQYSETNNPMLDIRYLPAGVYFLSFVYEEEIIVHKIITF